MHWVALPPPNYEPFAFPPTEPQHSAHSSIELPHEDVLSNETRLNLLLWELAGRNSPFISVRGQEFSGANPHRMSLLLFGRHMLHHKSTLVVVHPPSSLVSSKRHHIDSFLGPQSPVQGGSPKHRLRTQMHEQPPQQQSCELQRPGSASQFPHSHSVPGYI